MSVAYALNQAILHSSGTCPRSLERYQKWSRTVNGMSDGTLSVGSRQPVLGLPVWLTPEVLPGGFVSGDLLAGGPLLPFEDQLMKDNSLKVPKGTDKVKGTRSVLNEWFIGADGRGLHLLHRLLESGLYNVAVPEESAFLSVAWFMQNNDQSAAGKLVKTLRPHFSDVRFYPQPSSTPISGEVRCSRYTIADACRCLHADDRMSKASRRYLENKLIIDDFLPVYDRLIAIVLATCAEDGDLRPFEKPPSAAMVAEYNAVRLALAEVGKRFRMLRENQSSFEYLPKSSPKFILPRLRPGRTGFIIFAGATAFLDKERRPGKKKAEQDIKFARVVIAQIADSRGVPNAWSPNCAQSAALPSKLKALRDRQKWDVQEEPSFMNGDWVDMAISRVTNAVGGVEGASSSVDNIHVGLDNITSLLIPATEDEANKYPTIKKGAELPRSIERVFRNLQRHPLDVLVDKNGKECVTSMEVLASCMDQVLGVTTAQVFNDQRLRMLYSAIVASFRRRRSLLLLNYEGQIQLKELPWVAPFHETKYCPNSTTDSKSEPLREVLTTVVHACIHIWPHVLIPNKMLSAVDMLARGIGADASEWPGLLPELAADIFMGDFGNQWMVHARYAKQLLGGSLYECYYAGSSGLWNSVPAVHHGPVTGEEIQHFMNICKDLSGWSPESQWSVVSNGRFIEASMILTGANYPFLLQHLKGIGQCISHDDRLTLCVEAFASLKRCLRPALDSTNPWTTRLQATKKRRVRLAADCMHAFNSEQSTCL